MPYDDLYMIYDKTRHKYVLTTQCAQDLHNIDLLSIGDGTMNESNAAKQVLERVSRQIYNHIYRHAWHRLRTERDLALNVEHRQVLMDAMGDQLEWIVANGDTYNNAERELPGVCPMAHETLLAAGLLFAGNNSGEARDIVPEYDKEGY